MYYIYIMYPDIWVIYIYNDSDIWVYIYIYIYIIIYIYYNIYYNIYDI